MKSIKCKKYWEIYILKSWYKANDVIKTWHNKWKYFIYDFKDQL